VKEDSEGSRSSSTQDVLEGFRRIKNDVGDDLESLVFKFPKYRKLKLVGYIIAVEFDDGSDHTIYPKNLKMAKKLAEAMLEQVKRRIREAEDKD